MAVSILTDRRFLLFQLDLSKSPLEIFHPRSMNDSRKPGEDIRISDPSDYDNPASALYWRNVTRGQQYQDTFKDIFTKFLRRIISAVTHVPPQINLRKDPFNGMPWMDISPFVRNVSDYSVSCSEISNKLTLSLARPDYGVAEFKYRDQYKQQAGKIPYDWSDTFFQGLCPQENNILMVRSAYPDWTGRYNGYVTEYLGLVTREPESSSYGNLDTYTIQTEGMSKLLRATNIVFQQAVAPGQFFLPGLEINDMEAPSPYETRFNSLSAKRAFEGLIREIFAFVDLSKGLSGQSAVSSVKSPDNLSKYAMDPTLFLSAGKGEIGFQHNLMVLLTFYLMCVTPVPANALDYPGGLLFPPLGQSYPDSAGTWNAINSVLPNLNPNYQNQVPVVGDPIRAVAWYGDLEAYNKMVASGFELFYPQLGFPQNILEEVKGNTFYAVYEDRSGILVFRPPKYNKIEKTISSHKTESPDFNLLQPRSNTLDFFNFNPGNNRWEFNEQADFVITDVDIADLPEIDKNDFDLESRSDVTYLFPYAGDTGFPLGHYTDPDILFRYGLKTKGPIHNPNTFDNRLGAYISPITLALANASTRNLSLVCYDTRPYYVDKLYYIKPLDVVGYLVTDEIIGLRDGEINKHQLGFSMVRKVIYRPISEILGSPNELTNIGLMYTNDVFSRAITQKMISDTGSTTFISSDGSERNIRSGDFLGYSQAKGKALVGSLNDLALQLIQTGEPVTSEKSNSKTRGTPGITLAMYRYLPNILDMVFHVQSHPDWANKSPQKGRGIPPQTNQPTQEQATEAGKSALDQVYAPDNFLCATTVNQPVLDAGIIPAPAYEGAQYLPAWVDQLVRLDEGMPGDSPIPPSAVTSNSPHISAGYENYSTISQVKPPVGVSRVVSSSSGKPEYELIPLMAFETPFASPSLAPGGKGILLSQYLANKMAGLDLRMKFSFTEILNVLSATLNSKGGFPQMYSMDDTGVFHLFSKRVDYGQRYWDVLSGVQQRGLVNLILSSPNTLAFDPKTRVFSNSFFSIYPDSDGNLNLPFGHLITVPISYESMGFFKLSSSVLPRMGGKISITSPSSGRFRVELRDAQSIFALDDGGITTATGIGNGVDLSSPAFYFISPFTDITLERLLDLNVCLPIEYGGNITSQQADSLRLKGTYPGLLGNLSRQNGRAINISPDYLLCASGSDLTILGSPASSRTTPLGQGGSPFYNLFENLLAAYFPNGTSQRYPNALSGQPTYPDSSRGVARNICLYNLSVSDSEVNLYTSNLNPSPTGRGGVTGSW